MVSTSQKIRRRILKQGGSYWKSAHFHDLPPAAVSQTLSRMVKEGELERVSKGLYYRPRPTRFGQSRPSRAEIQKILIDLKSDVSPAGISAANLLGFTNQNAPCGEFATSNNSLPLSLLGSNAKLHTRRPTTWKNLSNIDAALLDFLRSRGKLSELSPTETKKKLLEYFQEENRFERLAEIADYEPPRVRAMLGAIGQELRKNPQVLKKLKNSLNPLSRFDFGVLSNLLYASKWQEK